VPSRRTLYERIWSRRAGDAVDLKIFRDNEVRSIQVPTADAEAFFS
jgi:S1-C subfamily serine protease